MASTPRTQFSQALRAVATERGVDPEVIIDSIKQAIIAAYKRDARDLGDDVEELEYDVELDSVTGETKIFLVEGKKRTDVTPPGFGRIAAQTAKQVIHQKIREAEKGAIMEEFSGRVGSLISGLILSFDGPNVRVDIGRAEAVMPAAERIPNERLNPGQRLSFLLKDIVETPRGKQIVLSRSDPEFVVKLFSREVPEISSGSVEIKGIARQAGARSKIAVFSTQSGVDPVGSCVGQKGVRVQSVTNELGGERVDIVPWSQDIEEFIKAALAPVEVLSIELKGKDGEKVATVKVAEDELSLAIGKDGQNVRLASQLTGYSINVEAAEGTKKKVKDEKEEPEEKEVNDSEEEKSEE